MTTEDYIKQALANKNASAVRRNQYNPAQAVPTFKSEFSADFGSNFTSEFGQNPDLNTSDGLYRIANQTGFKDKADKILYDNSGEDLNKIFSGGFISDTFDVLNMLSYGTVGLLKGKSFEDGIKNRESFSDKDSLGKYGWTGIGAGLIADIVFDPLTYIAPWTLLKKVPGVTRVGRAFKDAVVGREVTKIAPGATEAYTTLEGGIMGGKARAAIQKVAYMFGADPTFKDAFDTMHAMSGKEITSAMEMVKNLSKIDIKSTEQLLQRDETGRFMRTSIDDLKRNLSAEDYVKVEPIWNNIDLLGKRMVELGLLGSEKYEENLGKYIKSVYTEHELAKNKGFFGFKKVGIKGGKVRDENLTPENMKKLGQIEDPAFITGRTMESMILDIHNAEFLNKVAKFGSDVEFEGSVRVPDTRKFVTTGGADAQVKQHIGEINTQLTPLLRQLKQTFSADKDVLSEIKSLEKEIGKMSTLRAEELTKFFQEGEVVQKTVKTSRKLGVIPERLQVLATSLSKFDTFEEMINSRAGIKLQGMWHDGLLERNGFAGGEKAMRDFFEQVKNPYKFGTEATKEVELKGNIPRIIELQKRVEALTSKLDNVKDIDKKSINNSLINLERQINEARLNKDDLIETIHNNKMASLAGKYIPQDMYQYIDEMINPSEAFGNRVVSEFKYMKVVLNPGTHIRNMMSNKILNWWKLGIGPWRLDLDIQAGLELKNEGKYWKEWTSVGGGADTYAAAELKSMLQGPDTTFLTGKLGNYWTKAKKTLGDVYQGEEAHAKMSAFIAMRNKGHSIEEAYKMSQSATFNYAQVTPFIKKMRTAIWGMPFITFALKSAPVVVETIGKNPHRVSVFGKIRNDIKNASDIQETQEEMESEPPYMKEGFSFKLPVKDEYGRSMYFDLTYIIPFGDIISGGLFNQPVSKTTGTAEALPIAVASKNPVFQVLKELTRNETFTGEKIYKESDSSADIGADIVLHLGRTFAPPWVSANLPAGYNQQTGERADKGLGKTADAGTENQTRTTGQELAAYLGFKVQPMIADVNDAYQEWNKKKGLQTLLLENNIIENFSRNYIPKD